MKKKIAIGVAIFVLCDLLIAAYVTHKNSVLLPAGGFSTESQEVTSFRTPNYGFGTTTPAVKGDFFSTGTSTVRADSNSSTKGGCFALKDVDGSGYTYVYANNGTLVASTVNCN